MIVSPIHYHKIPALSPLTQHISSWHHHNNKITSPSQHHHTITITAQSYTTETWTQHTVTSAIHYHKHMIPSSYNPITITRSQHNQQHHMYRDTIPKWSYHHYHSTIIHHNIITSSINYKTTHYHNNIITLCYPITITTSPYITITTQSYTTDFIITTLLYIQ